MGGLKTAPEGAGRQAALRRLMSPASVAIIGMSGRPNTAGHAVLRNWIVNDFKGGIHLVGRSAGEIEGHAIETDMKRLPEGLDVAVLALPAASVGEALDACADRGVGAAVVFASGFAEVDESAREEQERIGRLVRDKGLLVLGPNCIGYTNYVEGFTVAFANVAKVPRLDPETRDGVAIVAQSGGLANHLRQGLDGRQIAVSYSISTGNEMDLGLGDFVNHLIADAATRVILVYAEDIRNPSSFLAAARAARELGKPIIMLHPGRSARAQEAARSHTGALAGDYAVMRAKVEHAGVVLVETLDELLDTTELLVRYPAVSPGGLGIVTFSGAFCGLAHDFCEAVDIELPPLSAAATALLKTQLPPFMSPANPLDLGTQPLWQPELVGAGVKGLLDEEAIGSVAISIPAGPPANANAYLKSLLEARGSSRKPVALAMLGDSSPLPPEFIQTARDNKLVLSRSSDRMLRAMGHLVRRREHRPLAASPSALPAGLPTFATSGPQPEYAGKKMLSALGVEVPRGRLVQTAEEAAAVGRDIGFPVVLKAQAAALAHKTEAGGVILNLRDEDAVKVAWSRLVESVSRAQPSLRLDGVLVEAMAPRGLEVIIGGRRDPRWGPVLMIGLGGVLVEALGDVRLMSCDCAEAEIEVEFGKLKAAKLLRGFRGAPPVDVAAAAHVAAIIGQLMVSREDVSEIEVNPLMVHDRGRGATALDVLIVTA